MTNLFDEYKPIIFKLEKTNSQKILSTTNDILFSNNIAYPEINLGFHHFIHATKDKMQITEKFENRKKVYLVTSLFEKNIDQKKNEEDNSINTAIKLFIENNIEKKYLNILSRAYLKLWEMIIQFDLIPEKDNFISSHLAEGPGSFIQATILYRDLQEKLKKIKTSKNDKYYAVSLHSENKHLLIEQEFIDYYNKEKPKRLHVLETVSKDEAKKGGGNLSDGDITKLKTINIFTGGGSGVSTKGFSEDSDLVTADGGFDWEKENLQEQEAYKLIFGQIVTALKINKKGGNFVLKIFDTYTRNTLKYLELLKQFYEEVYISKPFTSRISNSEKYVICKGLINKLTVSEIKKLEEMVETINKNEQYNIIELFSEYIIDEKAINQYIKINLELSKLQYIGINNIIKFINLDNYNGVDYHQYLENQIKASIFWNNTFLNPKTYNSVYKYTESITKSEKLQSRTTTSKKKIKNIEISEKIISSNEQIKLNLS
jgi:23S rRNA U2552 (ribose-2'-O)-methylase RlmE/FtsJ